MKNLIIAFLAFLALASCHNNSNPQTAKDAADSTAVVNNSYDHLYGTWVGYFMAEEAKDEVYNQNKITLIIKNINDQKVVGRSVVAGNDRPLQGTLTDINHKISFVLDEPGTDKYDGRFEFELRKDTLVGTWKSYKQEINVTKRSFKLLKKAFVYNANLMLDKDGEYIDWESSKVKKVTDTIDGKAKIYMNEYYRSASNAVFTLNSSAQELKESDLKNLRKLDLQILRNTIFARHGYTFKKKTYRQFFDFVDWYIPVSDNVESELTALEKKNIKLLERFEKYAEDNYDRFGR
ncbi:YARHG domain-containing protein [Pedobacter sp. ASV28]|uniref:YARHG domain-containing protein n=1 Tax=Pedobacter sp. ASV28 TaxID=2795123 RepID=UPI0018EC9DDD|nr:YARHG domain-containing protein [Pedobacter sp. ASV28]